MPQVRNEAKKTRAVEHSSLSNVQMELIKLYSTDLNHNELLELKELLVTHFSQKAIEEADRIWEEKKMTAQSMDDWRKKKLDKRYEEYRTGKQNLHDWQAVHEGLKSNCK